MFSAFTTDRIILLIETCVQVRNFVYLLRDYIVFKAICQKYSMSKTKTEVIPGAAQAGLEARPAAAIVNSPVCARAHVLCDGL